jgi:GH3 auxin-responsive promoter
LIATEGAVTFPYGAHPGSVLAIRSHFFEFETPDGSTRLAHELTRGSIYGVVLTTGGGLYRYRLGDLVEVVGFADQAPLLKFLGKSERTSDLVGEKLAEPFVRNAIEGICETLHVEPTFALLAPGLESPPRYTLYLQAPNLGELNGQFSQAIDDALSANPHYGYAVGIGQLAPASVHVIPSGVSAWDVYERRFVELGHKAGDIKPAFLDSWTGWGDRFGRK